MPITTKAPPPVVDLLNEVKESHPQLELAKIAVCMADSKAFTQGKLNLGKTLKFSEFNKIWQATKYDFCITLCVDVWYQILNDAQREALLDLHLTRCDVNMSLLLRK